MNVLLFLAPFSWGTQKREAAAPKASGCFTGGTCAVREEPGKQKPRSCRAQELARSGAQEDDGQKKDNLFNFTGIGQGPESGQPRRRERAAMRSPYGRWQEMWRGRPDVAETTLVEPGVGKSLAFPSF